MNQKRNALVSLGETANDLKDYSHALALYREVFEIERKMGLSEAKVCFNRNSISNCLFSCWKQKFALLMCH